MGINPCGRYGKGVTGRYVLVLEGVDVVSAVELVWVVVVDEVSVLLDVGVPSWKSTCSNRPPSASTAACKSCRASSHGSRSSSSVWNPLREALWEPLREVLRDSTWSFVC